jgi:hypothetical protein
MLSNSRRIKGSTDQKRLVRSQADASRIENNIILLLLMFKAETWTRKELYAELCGFASTRD